MTVTTVDVAARVGRLAATLGGLRDRVRAAVATEAGAAVADAVKDLLTAALGGRRHEPVYQTRAAYRPARRGWDRDDEDEDEDRGRWDDKYAGDDEPDHPVPTPPPARWPAALALAAGAAKAWAARRLPGWAAAAVGLAAGGLAVVGGPLLAAGLALAGAAADLLPHVLSAAPIG